MTACANPLRRPPRTLTDIEQAMLLKVTLRHTALTNAYRKSCDIRLVQRLARHKSVDTATVYASPSDEDILRVVRELPC